MKQLNLFILLLCNFTLFSQINTKDIDNFSTVLEKLGNCETMNDSLNCIDQIMFKNGTDGFVKFIEKYELTVEDYYYAVIQYPKFFNSVKENMLIAKAIDNEYLKLIDKIREYYPEYIPLDVYFVMSSLQCGGTVIDNFLFIGAEIVTSTNEVNLSEFESSGLEEILAFDTNVKERLIAVIAHETVHYLQHYAVFDNYELLNKSLIEGSADFIAKLFTGTTTNKALYDYGVLHEKDLWIKFKNDIEAGANTDDWMYNFDRVENGVPADLGYFIGYRIVESYYNNSTDKSQAIFDIIEMKDARAFLGKSKYNGNQ